ncbi:MAG: hypothetical protein CMN30_20075 [Sandaracinus sp.]|nr:hypothetical protein [Sandaracinus sp.]
MQIETDRLMLRAVEREDAGPTHYWNRDPEVMRHLGGVTHPELEAFTEFMGRIEAKYAAYRERGLPWQAFVVFERESWRPIGTGIFKPIPDAEDRDMALVEIGWHLARHVWGRGYATEMGAALRSHAFTVSAIDHVNALVDPANDASARVCERLGMTERPGGLHCRYGDVRRFVTTRDAWAAS